jgi:single-strand DNA-binding protein
MNQAFLTGNLGRDPEQKQTANGTTVVTFSLATRDRKDESTWHNITAFNKTAEIIAQYCAKGSKIAVAGRISNRQYEKDGEKRTWSEVIANEVELLDKKGDNPTAKPAPAPVTKEDEYEDDIPF